jgi:hypothetical protein
MPLILRRSPCERIRDDQHGRALVVVQIDVIDEIGLKNTHALNSLSD